MSDNEYILRLEIAKLLQKQREMQVREFESFSIRALELGAETKARSTIAAVELVDFVKDPLNNDNVKASMSTAKIVWQQMWLAASQTSASNAAKAASGAAADGSAASSKRRDDEEEVRSVSKLELLEKQLEELKKMLELQQQLASMTAAVNKAGGHGSTPYSHSAAQPQQHQQQHSDTPAATGLPHSRLSAAGSSSHNVLHHGYSGGGEGSTSTGPSGWSDGAAQPFTPSRPKMTDIMAAAKNVQLRKMSSGAGIAAHGARRALPTETAGLAGMLRHAMDKRFNALQPKGVPADSSPGSEASDLTDSPFGSPSSPRGGGAAKNRRLTISAGAVVNANVARRMSRGLGGGGHDDGSLSARSGMESHLSPSSSLQHVGMRSPPMPTAAAGAGAGVGTGGVGGSSGAAPATPVGLAKRVGARVRGDAVHDFSPLSPPSDSEGREAHVATVAAGRRPAGALHSALGAPTDENASAPTATCPDVGAKRAATGDVGSPARPVSMLAAIQGFNKSKLKPQAASKEEEGGLPSAPVAGTVCSASSGSAAGARADGVKSMASPPKGFNPMDVKRVTLKRTGAKLN